MTRKKFTTKFKTKVVLEADNSTRLSMDGKGRATDNAYIERFWRSLKYDKIYLNPSEDGIDLYIKIREYISYYNQVRRHSMIDEKRPSDLYISQLKAVA